jgi:hypothetical protein
LASARIESGFNPPSGAADELMRQAVGGRADGAGDGEGSSLPQPGALLNGSGARLNGA